MLPEWFDPSALFNGSVAAAIVSFVCWGLVKVCRFLGPHITDFFASHVGLVSALKENSIKQTEYMGRQVEMSDKQIETQNKHGGDLHHIRTRVDEIHEIIRRPAGPAGAKS